MTGWASKLNKAIKTAECIEKGVRTETHEEVPRAVKHYTLYSIGVDERPVAWRLYAADVPNVIAAAQRRMLRERDSIVERDPLQGDTRYEAREDIWN